MQKVKLLKRPMGRVYFLSRRPSLMSCQDWRARAQDQTAGKTITSGQQNREMLQEAQEMGSALAMLHTLFFIIDQRKGEVDSDSEVEYLIT